MCILAVPRQQSNAAECPSVKIENAACPLCEGEVYFIRTSIFVGEVFCHHCNSERAEQRRMMQCRRFLKLITATNLIASAAGEGGAL